ncbi:hypothetical protein V8B55DRAFT_1490352 [Mucor lusitanicus]|uniref:Uncharacterized protein n=2 Tax=Mucor circinelloides f. lusitanicus TaxID=29924 RepID=A0A162QNV0_MUCCL|nr:hypothetical protein MUCCIDRAFT_155633 [Mucor lusitanicus CBS 277.49]
MQPWMDKTTATTSKNSLHFDHTLSHLQQPGSTSQQQPLYKKDIHGFRTLTKGKEKEAFTFDEPQAYTPSQTAFSDYQPAPPIGSQFNAYDDPLDGSEVLNFLNAGTAYSDHIHGDDLRPDSTTYISHRHQVDTQHALSEREKLQHHWTTGLLSAEDIVDYLQNTNYTDDIYGIPLIGQWIKEAKEEAKQQKQPNTAESKRVAIERLNMIRQHLIQKANGDPNLAAKNAIEMTENDWSSSFS